MTKQNKQLAEKLVAMRYAVRKLQYTLEKAGK